MLKYHGHPFDYAQDRLGRANTGASTELRRMSWKPVIRVIKGDVHINGELAEPSNFKRNYLAGNKIQARREPEISVAR